MRVVHLSCVAPPEIGGIGSVALREVAGLRARGIDARLMAPEPKDTPGESGERGFVERLPTWLRLGNGAIVRGLPRALTGADVVHLHYPFYGTAEQALWRKPRVPVVVTFHMDAKPDGWFGPVTELHRGFVQPFLLNHASKVLVSSFDYAHRSSLETWFTDHADRVIELPFGVDTDFFTPGPSARQRFMIPPDAFTLAFVGGLDRAHAFKGVPELLQAFSRLDPAAHLILVGDGDLRASYEDQARALNVFPRVHFLGRADNATLRDAYRSADVFAFPSTSGAEAFGLAALEAEACGLPVVASDLPGVRTVVQNGRTGLLVPPKNVEALTSALATIHADVSRRRLMGTEARQWAVVRFSWDRHIDGLLAVYRSVCASPS